MNNIVDSNSNHSQVLRIDCDAPMTTKSDTTTRTSNNVEYLSITTTTYPQTNDWLQSTTIRTKEDIICSHQIAGNIIGINVVNRDDSIPHYVKADDEYS